MRQHPLSSTTGHAESTSPASSTCSGVTDSADPSVIALRRPSAFGVDSRPSELSRGVQEPHLPASRQLSYSSADVSARNCWQHALLACHVSRDSECSLAARRAGEDCGRYSRLRRCGRSPALVTAASSDTTTVVEPDSRGGRSDAGSRVRRVGGQMAERSSAVRPAAVQLVSSG
jgi:hypothetical protein